MKKIKAWESFRDSVLKKTKKREVIAINISLGCLVKNLVIIASNESPEKISEIVIENLARVVSDAGVDTNK
ncbi:MAG: hypothetical protein RR513_09130 [Muribaculaceae bacterium]